MGNQAEELFKGMRIELNQLEEDLHNMQLTPITVKAI